MSGPIWVINRLSSPTDLLNHYNTKPILNVELIDDVLTECRSIFRKQDIFKVAAEIAQISGDTAKVAQQVVKGFLTQEETL